MGYQKIEAFQIIHEIIETQTSPLTSHDFHEFIFIQSGHGIYLNQHSSLPFEKGDLFLIKPKEEHAYNIEQPTEVYIVRYPEATRLILKELIHNSNGKAVAPVKAKSPLNVKASLSNKDEILVLQILQLLSLLHQDQRKNENVCYYQLLCLIIIMERNLTYFSNDKNRQIERQSITGIINHIHKYLKDPEMLSLKYIADKFHISTNQLGLRFRKEMKQSVKQYINTCRMQVIEKQIKTTDITFSEIAYQFGYVDESHFYKRFKKYFGVSPTEYRKPPLAIDDYNANG
ncbi:AraC family transcriptional regulator [Sphingobacterium faecium]|uniref:AraC family transcriptional regulator n=1 Tax=Sphingobacterium faecium TaxID=34087 RepID=UPI0024699315|nr:AraC family transcriptional regulator [Sphingobacterium faecium]MDH5828776.1 AraC family transcriptional regulator [Sphingobacterium faecium]